MSFGTSVNSPVKARQAGVKIAVDATSTPAGRPNTVNNVVEGAIIFVGYNDDRGRPQTAMFFRAGDAMMSTIDTTVWCAEKLFPMTEWMRKDVDALLAARASAPVTAAELPSDDVVDVLEEPSETSQGTGDVDITE